MRYWTSHQQRRQISAIDDRSLQDKWKRDSKARFQYVPDAGRGCQPVVESAVAAGDHHVLLPKCTKSMVSAAIAAPDVPWDDLFVTSKVWDQDLSPDAIRRAFDRSLAKLRLDCVDGAES